MKHIKIIPVVLIMLLVISIRISAEEKPNIIIYLADDLGWQDVGFNGAKVVKTPNLDELAKQGLVFDNAFIASPV